MSDQTGVDESADDAHDEEPSAFIRWLRQYDDGQLVEELDDAFKQLVIEVHGTGKSGKLTLEVPVGPKGRTIITSGDVKVKHPPTEKIHEFFFPDAEGVLHRDEPNQLKLDLKTVGTVPGSLRVVNTETGEMKEVAR
ncbi:hypothetical protein [Desertimonas flava]|uniref:hypothetical protein n=1 Tax=Desertimonas flava TaxID=2064846 RepID=UPI0013C46526|nr:hypothetical protein [Desertimonas flava]